MKRTFFILGLIIPAIIILFPQCKKKTDESYPYKLKFITENYKPLNYTENGTITGLGPELLREICKQLNIPFQVQSLPWDQGYAQVQQTDNAVLFSTILNSNRKELFKWAGPYASLDWMFYAASQNQISLNTLEDAKTIGKIGVLADYAITQYLVGEGFTNLVFCTDNIDAFDRLLKGEIDLFPADKFTAEAAMQTLNKSFFSITSELTIRTDMVYFAFNKNVPDYVVADFQSKIDQFKNDGTLLKLYQKFMVSSDVPGTLQVYTEQYPPLTFRDNFGEISGFGTDIVKEIMKRNHLFLDITLSSWSNGYELALNNPNFCLFTMDRTAIRDTLLQWVGPIGTNTSWFYTKSGSGISINSINDAKNLTSVGAVDSWFSEQYMLSLGFTNLVTDPDPKVLTQKLMSGQIDAFVCTDVTFPDILKSLGYNYTQVSPSFSLMASDYYIAFSKTTAAATVNQWQSTFQALKLDGTYGAIKQKWLP